MPFILLSSARNDLSATRSFNEFQTRDDLAYKIIDYYEDYLGQTRSMNGTAGEIVEYTSDNLFDFVDQFFGELVCLEKQDEQTDLWIPCTKDWVKEAILLYLRDRSVPPTDGDSGNASECAMLTD